MKLRELHQVLGWDRILAVTTDFYARVAEDPRLAPYFAHLDDPSQAAERIARFWWRDLGGAPRQPGEVFNPHAVHRRFGVTAAAVDAWLEVFEATLRDHLPAEAAEVWLQRAQTFGEWTRIEMGREPPARR